MNKIAAIQMCSSNSVDDNLKTVSRLVARAASAGAQLVVLPEMFACMGATPQQQLANRETFGSGKIQGHISDLAEQHQLWIVAGTIPITPVDESPDKFNAAMLVFNESGIIIARYDKIHLFDAYLTA